MPDRPARRPTSEGWVRVAIPGWLWGNNPLGLFEAADLRARIDRGDPGFVTVRTTEAYDGVRPDLLRLLRIAGPTARADGLRLLRLISDEDVDADVLGEARDQITKNLQEMQDGPPGLLPLVQFHQLAALTTPVSRLEEQVRAGVEQLLEVCDFDNVQMFPHAGVFGVRRSDALMHRSSCRRSSSVSRTTNGWPPATFPAS